MKVFVAAGLCYFNEKISINLYKIKMNKNSKFELKQVFYHELGHAFDDACLTTKAIKYPKTNKKIKNCYYSENSWYKKVNQQCVKNLKKENVKFKKKLKYYVMPSFQMYNLSKEEFIQVMNPSLIYLLKHIDWKKLGVPERNLINNTIKLKKLINKNSVQQVHF